MLKTYDSEQIAALDYAAYSKGDPQAGRRIQKEIAAGTAQRDLARLAEEFFGAVVGSENWRAKPPHNKLRVPLPLESGEL